MPINSWANFVRPKPCLEMKEQPLERGVGVPREEGGRLLDGVTQW